jgi:hypothetical protein
VTTPMMMIILGIYKDYKHIFFDDD